MKVKVSDITDADLHKIEKDNIKKCKAVYNSFPVATKTWIALKTGINMSFISKHWKDISS